MVLINKLPVATLLAVVFSIVAGLVQLIDPAKLSFEEYLQQITVLWGLIAVGRGLAVNVAGTLPDDKYAAINAFPWATVVAIVVGVVGYIGVITDSTLDWQEYGTQMAILVGSLGLGRGLGALKKDTANVLEPEDARIDLINDDAGIEEVPAK